MHGTCDAPRILQSELEPATYRLEGGRARYRGRLPSDRLPMKRILAKFQEGVGVRVATNSRLQFGHSSMLLLRPDTSLSTPLLEGLHVHRTACECSFLHDQSNSTSMERAIGVHGLQ